MIDKNKVPDRLYIDRGPRGGWMTRDKRMPDTEAEYIRADLAAPKVKPLVWDEHNWIASTGFGYVRIENKPAGWWNSLTKSYEPTMHAAKAAAQADYERRILDALE